MQTMRFSKQRNVWLIAGREYRTSYIFPRINETVVSPPPCVPVVESCRQDFEGKIEEEFHLVDHRMCSEDSLSKWNLTLPLSPQVLKWRGIARATIRS